MSHPRDRFVTLYGRKPVYEALLDDRIDIDKVLIARGARGDVIDRIVAASRQRGIEPRWQSAKQVTRISRNGRQDQGVAADVVQRRMMHIDAFVADPPARARVFVLDGVTTPANVGLIIRAATAAGADGIVMPRAGCPEVGPLVVKASAGIALRAPILRAATAQAAVRALREVDFEVWGLAGESAVDLYEVEPGPRSAWVLGSEAIGMSDAVRAALTGTVRIPMESGVESLNVATAAAVVAFELARRGR